MGYERAWTRHWSSALQTDHARRSLVSNELRWCSILPASATLNDALQLSSRRCNPFASITSRREWQSFAPFRTAELTMQLQFAVLSFAIQRVHLASSAALVGLPDRRAWTCRSVASAHVEVRNQRRVHHMQRLTRLPAPAMEG